MLMTVISLAISLAFIQSLPRQQQKNGSNQTPQKLQQDRKDSNRSAFVLNLPLTVSVQPVALPPGDNAWAVQIVSSGGFTGSGRGDVTLTSDGLLIRIGPDGSCSRKLPDQAMQSLTKTVFAANSVSNADRPATSLCLDCYVTGMVITRRRVAGDETTNAFSWDDANQAKVAADIMNIYQAVLANKDCKVQ